MGQKDDFKYTDTSAWGFFSTDTMCGNDKNWKAGFEWVKYKDAFFRHLWILNGEHSLWHLIICKDWLPQFHLKVKLLQDFLDLQVSFFHSCYLLLLFLYNYVKFLIKSSLHFVNDFLKYQKEKQQHCSGHNHPSMFIYYSSSHQNHECICVCDKEINGKTFLWKF